VVALNEANVFDFRSRFNLRGAVLDGEIFDQRNGIAIDENQTIIKKAL
jgi:hypothetical protein